MDKPETNQGVADQQKGRSSMDARGSGKALMDVLGQQVEGVKRVADNFFTEHQEALDSISQGFSDEFERNNNKYALQKLTGRESIDKTQQIFNFSYKGKEVTLIANELLQITSCKIQGRLINLKKPLNPEDFQWLFHNSQNVLDFLKSSDPPLLPGVPLTADGTARFSFMVGPQEYMAVGGNDVIGNWLYRIDERISAEEEQELDALRTEAEALKLKIKKDIIKERRLDHPVFNLDDAIFTPSIGFPKLFRPSLERLNTILSRLRYLEEAAKTVTMTECRNNERCLMENLGGDSFHIKHKVREGVELLEASHDCLSEYTYEDGLMVQKQYHTYDYSNFQTSELLPDGRIKISAFLRYSRGGFHGGRACKIGDTEMGWIRLFDEDMNQLSQTKYESGRPITETHYCDGYITEVVHFTSDTQRPAYKRIESLILPDRFAFIGKDGMEYSDYLTERREDPTLTPDRYIANLATVFDSPAAWHNFSKVFVDYVYDSPDSDHPLLRGTKEKHGEYWQTAEETVSRVNDRGQALGDCDDFAFLAQAVLAKQGVRAQVITISEHGIGHAICVWIKRRPDGNYDAYSICTFGYDKNGNRFDPDSMPEAKKDTGFKTPEEALNSLFVKYEESGLGVAEGIHYRVEDGKVEVLSIPQAGEKKVAEISVEDLIVSS